jgi:RNA polymerase sigma factor (sigma-70 family)
MLRRPLGTVLTYLNHLVAPPRAEEATDRELLERFTLHNDQPAFAVLVRRHSSMVLGVCWRLLRHMQDAEDAMQAVFVVLARKAAGMAWGESVAGWLHQVARRVALEARGVAAQRRQRERQLDALAEPPAAPSEPQTTEAAWRELSELLDGEIQRLPARYRDPLVLCYLEGRTRDEAAEQLGWTVGSVKGRLERGRGLLRRRLVRRGLSLSAALSPLLLGQVPVQAALLPTLHHATLALVAGQGAAGTGGTTPTLLAEITLKAMAGGKAKVSAVLVLTLAGLGAAVGAALRGPGTAPTQGEPPLTVAVALPDDPLPEVPPVVQVRHEGVVRSVAFSPDGKTLASSSFDRTIGLWDPATGKSRGSLKAGGQISCVAFDPDGKRLVSGGPDGCVRLWDLTTNKEVHTWNAVEQHIYATAWSPDGKFVAVACQGGEVFLWDPKKAAVRHKLAGHLDRVWAVAFSPDGRTLASVGEDRTLRLWDVESGDQVRRIVAHGEMVSVVQWSADGRLLVTADVSGSIKLWERATGEEMTQLGQLRNRVQWLCLSPGAGRGGAPLLLATAHANGKVIFWDLRTRKPLHEIQAHEHYAYSVVFSPDRKTIASGSENGSVRVGPVPHTPATAREELKPGVMEQLVKDLAEKTPVAFQALCRLSAGQGTVPWLKARLQPVKPDPEKRKQWDRRLTALLTDLNDDDFQKRETAAEDLKKLGPDAIPALRGVLAGKPSVDLRRRARGILDDLLAWNPDAETRQVIRTVQVLEMIHSPEARQLVENLSRGAEEALLTREARATLERWGR